MKQSAACVLSLILLLSLSSCRYFYWSEDIFNQGVFLKCYGELIDCYTRHIRVYDQFTTLGLFDVLWLHDQVRMAYSKIYSCRRGLSLEHYDALLRRQLQENKHFISFYVLAAIPSYDGAILGDKDAMWSVSLCINNQSYTPIETKIIELTPEYRKFFGETYTKFKTPYLVKFNARDIDGNPIITSSTERIILFFRRICREEYVEWELNDLKDVVCCCDCDPDLLAYDMNDNI